MAKGKFIKISADPISALEGAASELSDLAEEMRNWADNMESANMSHMEKFEVVQQTAETLESADLGQIADTLADKLRQAAEGEEGNAACPKHVWGTPCSNCGWSGQATKLVVIPVEQRSVWKTNNPADTDKPMRLTIAKLMREGTLPSQFVSRELVKFNACWAEGDVAPAEAIAAAEARLQLRQDKEEARLRRSPPPAGWTETKFQAPIPELATLLEQQIHWNEFRPYGKKSISRASRFDNAMCAAMAARDAIGTALEQFEGDAARDAAPDVIEELREAFEELETAIEELEGGIEFPGMYG